MISRFNPSRKSRFLSSAWVSSCSGPVWLLYSKAIMLMGGRKCNARPSKQVVEYWPQSHAWMNVLGRREAASCWQSHYVMVIEAQQQYSELCVIVLGSPAGVLLPSSGLWTVTALLPTHALEPLILWQKGEEKWGCKNTNGTLWVTLTKKKKSRTVKMWAVSSWIHSDRRLTLHYAGFHKYLEKWSTALKKKKKNPPSVTFLSIWHNPLHSTALFTAWLYVMFWGFGRSRKRTRAPDV